MTLFGDKQVTLLENKKDDLIRRQTCSLIAWGTNRMYLLRNKQVALFGDKQLVLIGRQAGYPYWGTDSMSLLEVLQVGLIGGQRGCP